VLLGPPSGRSSPLPSLFLIQPALFEPLELMAVETGLCWSCSTYILL
jgi:hypothetical protein